MKTNDESGAFHLVKISGISGSAVNGTRFVGSSHWKIPRKSGKSKKGLVKKDGAFKFYEQESSRRGMSYYARPTTHDPRPTTHEPPTHAN